MLKLKIYYARIVNFYKFEKNKTLHNEDIGMY